MNVQELTDWHNREWVFANQRVHGGDVLSVVRPGLELVTENGAIAVPRGVFHDWLYLCAERLLKAHIGWGHLEDHESEWLATAIAIVATAKDPPGEDAEELRGTSMMLLASLNTFSAIRQKSREMGHMYSWVSDALIWATKRYLGDRTCPHDPASLAASALELHGQIATLRVSDATAALEAERVAQLDSLLECWRDQATDD